MDELDEHDDGLAVFKGVMVAIAIVAPFWTAVFLYFK